MEPGRIARVPGEGLVVACGGGSAYLIERLQRENRNELAAADFLRGTKIEAGDRLD
jgi:methionyl-tRNA formyltransferase